MSQAISRYASTLFELASSDKKLAAVEKDAKAILAAFDASGDLLAALKSPLYANTDKVAVMTQIGKKLKTSPLVMNFVSVVTDNGRAGELPSMFKAFLDLAANARGAVKAQVSTASELSASQIEELKQSLSRAFKAEVEVETNVKPDLIGGLVVKVGSRLFDDSIKTKLDSLKISLKGA